MKDRTGKGNSVCFFTHLFLFPVLTLKAVRYTEVDVSLAIRYYLSASFSSPSSLNHEAYIRYPLAIF